LLTFRSQRKKSGAPPRAAGKELSYIWLETTENIKKRREKGGEKKICGKKGKVENATVGKDGGGGY